MRMGSNLAMGRNKKREPWRIAVDILFLICAGISVVSTIVYLISGRVVPGLSPFSLAAALLIVAFGLHGRAARSGEDEHIMELVFIIACFLNIFVGFMQIHAYFIGQ